MEYKLVSHVRIECFDQRVKQFLTDGWELYGHPFSTGLSVCQAMVKIKEPINVKEEIQMVPITKSKEPVRKRRPYKPRNKFMALENIGVLFS